MGDLSAPDDEDIAPGGSQETPWVDLSLNRPGQAAREQADAHLAAARERSRFWSAVMRLLDAKTEERAWRVGAYGEETVGARLMKLEEHGWRVLHSVPVGNRGSDIDHLLIGPGGVWTINTKNHPGKNIWVSPKQVRVSGQPVPYLRNSQFEADRVRSTLTKAVGWEPFVKAALVILTGGTVPQITVKGMPEHVMVLNRLDVPRWFKRREPVLTPEQVEALFEVARRSTTWQPPK